MNEWIPQGGTSPKNAHKCLLKLPIFLQFATWKMCLSENWTFFEMLLILWMNAWRKKKRFNNFTKKEPQPLFLFFLSLNTQCNEWMNEFHKVEILKYAHKGLKFDSFSPICELEWVDEERKRNPLFLTKKYPAIFWTNKKVLKRSMNYSLDARMNEFYKVELPQDTQRPHKGLIK